VIFQLRSEQGQCGAGATDRTPCVVYAVVQFGATALQMTARCLELLTDATR